LCHLRSTLNYQVEAGSTIATPRVHQNPWCQHLGSRALACRDPAEPDNADLGAAATL
jgi:hypothetical protein